MWRSCACSKNEEGGRRRSDWTLAPDEDALVSDNRGGPTRLGSAVLVRFFAREGRFPAPEEVSEEAVAYVAGQLDAEVAEYLDYDYRSRTAEYHRAQVQQMFGFRPATADDADELAAWPLEEVASYEYDAEQLKEADYACLRSLRIEPPTLGRVDRLVCSALRSYDGR